MIFGESSIERRAREADEEADRWFRAGARACECLRWEPGGFRVRDIPKRPAS